MPLATTAAVAAAAANVPWRELMLLIPDLVNATKKLLRQLPSKPKPIDPSTAVSSQIAALSSRLEALEANEATQAKVVSEIAEQLQILAIGLKETAARQTLVLWLGIGATGISLCALVLAVMRST